jgi:hypothetical protein
VPAIAACQTRAGNFRLWHRIRQHPDLLVQREEVLGPGGDVGADEDEPRHTLGVQGRHLLGDGAPHRVPDHDGPLDAEGVEERNGVGSEVGLRVAGGRALGVAMAALAEREGAEGGGQVRQHRRERIPRVGDAVEEEDGLAVGRAGLGVLEAHARRQSDGAEVGERVRVHRGRGLKEYGD